MDAAEVKDAALDVRVPRIDFGTPDGPGIVSATERCARDDEGFAQADDTVMCEPGGVDCQCGDGTAPECAPRSCAEGYEIHGEDFLSNRPVFIDTGYWSGRARCVRPDWSPHGWQRLVTRGDPFVFDANSLSTAELDNCDVDDDRGAVVGPTDCGGVLQNQVVKVNRVLRFPTVGREDRQEIPLGPVSQVTGVGFVCSAKNQAAARAVTSAKLAIALHTGVKGYDATHSLSAFTNTGFATAIYPLEVANFDETLRIEGPRETVYDLGCKFLGARTVALHLELRVDESRLDAIEPDAVTCAFFRAPGEAGWVYARERRALDPQSAARVANSSPARREGE